MSATSLTRTLSRDEREQTKEAGRLIWRCRRGTKELDVLLQRYLDRHYKQATAGEQHAFENLLELQDPELQDHLTGHLEVSEPDTRNVIRRILAIEA